ncbi:MAG: hypothetical protein IPH28_20020 [Cytophagaceae bacterium]|nr:hypothetical protein [Cytophagaceae bacterium]
MSLPSTGNQIFLYPGKDTLLTVYVSNNIKTSQNNNIVFYVKSKAETQMITGTVYFAEDTYIGHKKKYGVLPFDIEYVGVNAFCQIKVILI